MTTASKTKTQTMFSLVNQWKTSSKTQQQFSAEYDLKVGTFAYWVAKHKQAGVGKPAGGFVGVDVSGLAEVASVRIAYPNGVVVSCPANLPLISQLIHLA
jgi:ABC-type thiamine transport system substrate-binding protein